MLISIRTNTILMGNQKKVEGHLEAAALHHEKAASQLKEGKYEEAAQNAILAQKYLDLASETKREETQEEI